MCFVGLVVIVEPWQAVGLRASPWAYVASFAASILAGLVYTALRELRSVSYHVVLNVFQGTCLILSLVVGIALAKLPFPPLQSPAWRYLAAVGATAYAAEVCITCGFGRAGRAIGQVSVLKYLSPILSIVWAVLFLGEKLRTADIVGALLIFTSSGTVMFMKHTSIAGREKGGGNPYVGDDLESSDSGDNGDVAAVVSKAAGRSTPGDREASVTYGRTANDVVV